jgi:hypothetical protein
MVNETKPGSFQCVTRGGGVVFTGSRQQCERYRNECGCQEVWWIRSCVGPGTDEALEIALRLERDGSGFASALATAYILGDLANKARILLAFQDLFQAHRQPRK